MKVLQLFCLFNKQPLDELALLGRSQITSPSSMSIRGRKFIDFLRYNVPFLSGSTSAPIHKTSYWDAIYQDSFVFEWGVQPKILGDELMGLQKGPTCVLGAGTSVLGSELAQRGFKPLGKISVRDMTRRCGGRDLLTLLLHLY